MYEIPEGLTDREKAILELHKPMWEQCVCPTPIKGCDREDCYKGRPGWYSNYHWHREGFQVCGHCSDTGDPYHLPPGADEYPCPTAAIILGEAP